MMSYRVRVYENTGYNSVNLPWSKKYLCAIEGMYPGIEPSAVSQHDIPDVEIVQNRFLSSIRLPLTWSEVNQCDYITIYSSNGNNLAEHNEALIDNGWCYFVTGIKMVAKDVAELSLVPDYITSVNGCARFVSSGDTNDKGLIVVDGIVKRSTWALKNVNQSELDMTDDYLAPSGKMTLKIDRFTPDSSGRTIILSTINIGKAGMPAFQNGIAFGSVTVPVVPYVLPSENITFSIGGNSQEYPGVYGNLFSAASSGSILNKGLSVIRALGLEGAIIAQYFLPSDFANVTVTSDQSGGFISNITGLSGVCSFGSSNVGNNHTGTIGSKLNLSSFEKVGILSASGSRREYMPQEIPSYTVKFLADPRSDGKPYFAFVGINGVADSNENLIMNAVEGNPWTQVPLVWQGASGNAINTLNFKTRDQLSEEKFSLTERRKDLRIAEDTNKLTRLGRNMDADAWLAGSPIGSPLGLALSGIGELADKIKNSQAISIMSGRDIDINKYNQQLNEDMYTYKKDNLLDKLAYDISNSFFVPEIKFPYSADIYTLVGGNGVVRYKYVYSDNDLPRLKKILKAYGAKYSDMLSSKYFGDAACMNAEADANKSREYLYIQTSSCSVSGRAKWLNDGIAEQLNNGIRFWKGRPKHIELRSGE